MHTPFTLWMNFFACTDDMYYWLIWLCKFLHCNNFVCLVCFCMFLTCSYCLVTASGIYGMYICMYVCIYVCMYVYMYVCLNFTKPIHFGSRDSSVGIATRYGLQGPGIQSRWGDDIFHTRPERPWGPPNLLYNGYRVFTGGKAAGAWRWPPHPRLVARLNKE